MSPQDARPRRGTGESVLLVDDEAQLISVTTKVLESAGYRVTALTNPIKALETLLAAPKQFQLLLSDLNMPELTGLELVRRLRTKHPEFPVILLSGFITEEHRAKAGSDRHLLFLQKPASTRELTEAIHQVLNGQLKG